MTLPVDVSLVSSVVAILLMALQPGAQQQATVATVPVEQAKPNTAVEFSPQWHVGDRWVVETRTRHLQSRMEQPGDPTHVVRWGFHVAGTDTIDQTPCWRVEVSPSAAAVPHAGGQPPGHQQLSSRLWVSQRTYCLVRVESKLPSRGGQVITTVETYTPLEGVTSPVFGPLTVLPLDVPAFSRTGEKQVAGFAYTKRSGAAAVKGAAEPAFAFEVAQEVMPLTADAVKALADGPFVKDADLAANSAVKVVIRGPGRVVEQVWRRDQPWPIHAANGSTDARLVEVTRSAMPPAD